MLNAVFAGNIIGTLYQQGVRHIGIAPGSRSAPLALAAFYAKEKFPDIKLHTHFDERGLAFYALNLARVTNSPVVVITTSGTAVANLYPAVIEAYETHTPLWVVSADRPDRLLGCGANQAVQQKALFGHNVLRSFNFVAEHNNWPQALQSMGELKGPVQINCQFDEPLYGGSREDYLQALTVAEPGIDKPKARVFEVDLRSVVQNNDSIIIVLGSLTVAQADVLRPWISQLNCLVIADIASQFRFSDATNIISHADLLLLSDTVFQLLQPACVLQLGGRIVSKRIHQWLENRAGDYWLLEEDGKALDPSHRAKQLQLNFSDLEIQLEPQALTYPESDALLEMNARIEREVERLLCDQWSEAAVCHQLINHCLDNTALLAANSLSVRMLDSYASGHQPTLKVFTNRGASGIDGLIASAAALAWGECRQVVLVIGDTAFLHDLNSLALLAKLPCPVKILLLNNHGGQIFGLLDAGKEEAFSDLFVMPHQLKFEKVSQQFGLAYFSARTTVEYRESLSRWLLADHSAILECEIEAGSVALITQNLEALAAAL
ncbi:2-succinyl-5-enolpyruvyl-6-hydroxy-3-cyclohexene-1-carboxylic-acid synthase [Teredinibacter haidensis]|uniref:2-succinyl-5-enolpyruvyl-6-hydroxy-3- cyclohexene-1-carboxylic-acid synthase n=1 Tax=Teredinibacter haidensis TaxID=2731755 RepID=UPI000948A0AE|nr:2-succinyl-5-enolpyruvyl-6-hydroxy-3-cyclohexene-1-carboxylic-acid synthase [Teredinibacter haidensis]